MRIGLVCPYDLSVPGGVQNQVFGLAGWLNTEHEVSIIGPGEPPAEVLERYELASSQFTTSGGSIPLRFNGSVARVNLGFKPLRKLRLWLSEGDFDLIHVHEPLAFGISPWALAFRGGRKVVTCHSSATHHWPWRVAAALHPLAIRRVDAAIAVSTQASVLARSYLPNPPVIIGNGISLVSKAGESVSVATLPRIIFIGRHDEPRKGLEIFLEAIRLVRQVLDVEAIVVGDGSPRDDEGIKYLGRLSDDERNSYLLSSDVYVAPHLGNESFGIVIIEAAAAGVHVVASGLPAFRELMSDSQGEIASFFDTGNASQAADQIISACQPDPDRIRRGMERAKDFSWETIGPKVLQVYEAACH